MNNKKIVIAIDGYSSCGKSTFAKVIAKKLGYLFIDSGAMYRAVTYYAMQNNMVDDPELLNSSLKDIKIKFQFNPLIEKSELYLNGVNVEKEIRTTEVTNLVSTISANKNVRELLSLWQQQMGEKKGIVMDGRDIGTTVFPNAELKIFMTASPDVRAKRRYTENVAKGDNTTLEEIKKKLLERDYKDENRSISPLRKAEDAITLDNSSMSVEEQMEWVEKIINDIIL